MVPVVRVRLLADLGVAAFVTVASLAAMTGRTSIVTEPYRTVDFIASAGLPLLLLWRRRAPVVVLWATIGFIWAADLVGLRAPFPLIMMFVALYTVARYRPWPHLLPSVAVIGGTFALHVLFDDGVVTTDVWVVPALLACTVLLGLTVRTRQAYRLELEERNRTREREREHESHRAAAAERNRIAREMHDIVAHNLVVMVALADGASFAAPPGKAADAMRQVSATGRQALGEMRRLVGLLRDSDRDPDSADDRAPQPGLDDLDDLIDGVRTAGLSVALTREGQPGDWGPGAGLAVYRIVQEALTNTLKHAGPRSSARVSLRYTATGADIEVVDDGAGRSVPAIAAADRHGLGGMQERAAAYGGTVVAGPRPGAGWLVHTRLSFVEPSLPGAESR